MVIVYNPENLNLIKERIAAAEKILSSLPYKNCFISGSFLYKEKYKDIDVFVMTRSRKKIKTGKKINIIRIDFNDIYSLFYYSSSKSCIAKNLLPKKDLKATAADYWNVINEAVPALFNQKKDFKKEIRFLVLYTEYFANKKILDTYELMKKISCFKNYKSVLNYINENVPEIIRKNLCKSYVKKYFYTSSGMYRDALSYPGIKFLYALSHSIIRGAADD
jgi:hypothetical protein